MIAAAEPAITARFGQTARARRMNYVRRTTFGVTRYAGGVKG